MQDPPSGVIRPIDHVLERLKVTAKSFIDDEVQYVMSEAELVEYRMEAYARTAMELRSHVLAERLEPEVQTVSFRRPVVVEDTEQRLWRLVHPRTRWDAVKVYLLPSWLRRRLKPARLRAATSWTAHETRTRVEEVEINEQVRIERAMTFPGATVRFPKELGKPVYREWRSQ